MSMKKILIAVLVIFASSLVFLISCDKESITPLISEENQGINEKNSSNPGKVVCCKEYLTLLSSAYTPGRVCCLPSDHGSCLPCVTINWSSLNDKIVKLDSLLNGEPIRVVEFFNNPDNYSQLFPRLSYYENIEFLELLLSGQYILIDIVYDSNTKTYVYIFENINDKSQIGLPFSIFNS